ncbi:type II toxin-antitoxin system PemK/MazF family toxin [Lysobacter sp. K5869]|uniref:type II toxin-antitoxin system PemK/MazF family toxin n=1 Tax=Lysobacter sp. K5869 TaxID=2820808 RepID=UPI001C06195B|nr:type II toxin-antitoxin system PemK/MazF family toxin [Lysobacter sp. K5869]QWP75822.1 type II toxin-antitoxin system PemK/MazF family toxin [Lysobacter sp. K5869]
MDRDLEAFAAIAHDRIAQGEVFWLPPDPARGSVPGAPHPHVVVQDDLFNRSRIATVVVCALSTNPARAAEPGNVALEPGEGGLPRRSVVVVSQISCVYKARLGERIGALSPERVAQILAGLRFVQSAYQR